MKRRRPCLIPLPARLAEKDGYFVLDHETRIVAPPEFSSEVAYFKDKIRVATGLDLREAVAQRSSKGSRIEIRQSSEGRAESYSLRVSEDLIRLEAPDGAGAFYGIQTLLQLLPPAIGGRGPRVDIDWMLPCCEIEDGPRFGWRGMMLDSARHFQSVPFIKRWIDLLAQHKFNVFHWHLTDHQGWRFEVSRYPKLTEVGAWREGTALGHYFAGAKDDGKRYGGFYSKADLREIVAYASRRHITIVPEIEMPGHCQAALAAYPELGLPGEGREVSRRWGGHEAMFNLNESTLKFLFEVLDEVIEIFPSPCIHIGGDEAASAQWELSKESTARMAEIGVKTPREAHTWFIRRIGEFLASRGRRLAGWDEITEPGLPGRPTILSWCGQAETIKAAENGYQVVMCPYHSTYLDYYQTAQTETEPLGNRDINVAFIDLDLVYAYEPVSASLSKQQIEQVAGVQGQIWTEYIPEEWQVEYMAFPRACALAEVAWTDKRLRDLSDFRQRLPRHLKRLDCQGVRYRPPDGQREI